MLSAKRATKNDGPPSARWPPPDGKSWTNCTIPWWTDRSSTRWVTWWNHRYCSRPRRTSIRYGQESGKWRRVLATLSLYAFGNDYKIYNWSLNMKRPFSILRWRCAVATPWVLEDKSENPNHQTAFKSWSIGIHGWFDQLFKLSFSDLCFSKSKLSNGKAFSLEKGCQFSKWYVPISI